MPSNRCINARAGVQAELKGPRELVAISGSRPFMLRSTPDASQCRQVCAPFRSQLDVAVTSLLRVNDEPSPS
ncbi:uncharacterized protein PITG_10766 [Phytophthora infestans T30-4]|uniref:Uncharacterized protein n=1 Tax=Phytophthora infestans (strain T30-4) TaxID=403677 RepID=D0NH14_PHYIT|nr:uncharacterized protein PITG_10766 [Phytophthora infestans T30-4]EEY58653.1 hypothetical protein PITG_10766 [Phytophthora infestans T30-4]|eukprot:XP_002901597.1 hypothetical protein PITG_10766 [Phytophthora infestans T30-4]